MSASLLKVGALCGLGAGLVTASQSFYTVPGGSGGIVFNRFHGIKDKVYPEGTHLLIPFIERPIIFNLRASLSRFWKLIQGVMILKRNAQVKINLRALTRPKGDQLPTIYRTLGLNFNNTVLSSIMQETLKAVVAKYNANQLITQREAVSKEIHEILDRRATQFNIAVDDVSITDLSFGKEFTIAIEAKQIAAQEAERAKFIVEKAEQDKKSVVIRAQGEAKSAQLIGQSIKDNPAFIALRKIEAAREIAKKIATSNNKVYLNSGDLLLNLQGIEMEAKN